MPRCLMAKKWKAYPWQDRAENSITNQQIANTTDTVVITTTEPNNIDTISTVVIEEDEEIDVVGDSPTANASSSSSPSVVVNNSNSNSHNSYTANLDTQQQQHANSSVIVGKTSIIPIPTCWGPSSPTAGTTAEEAHSSERTTRDSTVLYNGKLFNHFSSNPFLNYKWEIRLCFK